MERILIVDDSLVQAYVLKQILDSDYKVESCTDGLEVFGLIPAIQPSLILLDLILPKVDGFEILSRLKQDPATRAIPVILITGLADSENEEKGLLLGAVDYITKPYHAGIVRARVHTHTELYAYRKAMERLAQIDGLTGIPNRRYFDKQCAEEWDRAIRHRTPLSIGLLDVDYFKQYNDIYGHMEGDDILRTVAKTIFSTLRQSNDFTARYGGEEFGFLMPGTMAGEGKAIAQKVCGSVEALGIPHVGSNIASVLTVSIGGVTVYPKQGESFSKALKSVDDMLYKAKDSGRNSVAWSV